VRNPEPGGGGEKSETNDRGAIRGRVAKAMVARVRSMVILHSLAGILDVIDPGGRDVVAEDLRAEKSPSDVPR